jgi:hypothetical protein
VVLRKVAQLGFKPHHFAGVAFRSLELSKTRTQLPVWDMVGTSPDVNLCEELRVRRGIYRPRHAPRIDPFDPWRDIILLLVSDSQTGRLMKGRRERELPESSGH